MAEAGLELSRARLRRGLYVVTAGAEGLPQDVAAAVRGGAVAVQYRDKTSTRAHRLRLTLELNKVCRDAGVTFIVNDDVELALAAGADGVHLGRDDLPLPIARRRLGNRLIGVSCYDSLDRALDAEAGGADYVAFGCFFPSPTKPAAPRADIGLLRAAHARLGVPIVAIGGVTAGNGAALVAAGADCLAAVSGVFAQPDVEAAARRYADLFP